MLTRVYQSIFAIMIGGLVIFASCHKKEKSPLVPDGYRLWNKPTNTVLNYPVPGDESNYRVIYINAAGETVQTTKKNNRVFYEYPEGTMIVKEIYEGLEPPKKDKIPKRLTVMIKDAHHPESRGSWLWLVKDMKTGQETIIDYEFCFECHSNANEHYPYDDGNPNNDFRDYVFFPPLHALPPKEKGNSSYSSDSYGSSY